MQISEQPNIHYDFRNPESVAKAINLKKNVTIQKN